MAQVKFYRGLKANYNSTTHANGLYFATDTEELLLDGKVYGNLSQLAVSNDEDAKIELNLANNTLSIDYDALITFLTTNFITGSTGVDAEYDSSTGTWEISARVDESGYIITDSGNNIVIDPSKIATSSDPSGDSRLATAGYADEAAADAAASAAEGAFKGVTPTVSLTKQGNTNTYSGTISFYDNESGTGSAVKTTAISFDASDFVKDGILDTVTFVGSSTDVPSGKTAPGSDYPYLLFTFVVGVTGQKTDIWVSVKDLVDTYTAGDGLNLSNGEFSVKAKTGGYIAVESGNNGGVALDSAKITHSTGTESGTDANLVTKKYVDDKAVAGLEWIDVPAGA